MSFKRQRVPVKTVYQPVKTQLWLSAYFLWELGKLCVRKCFWSRKHLSKTRYFLTHSLTHNLVTRVSHWRPTGISKSSLLIIPWSLVRIQAGPVLQINELDFYW